MPPDTRNNPWPALPYEAWRDTCATLHLWTQIVGKIRLARTPWLNHSWHVPFYVTARGLRIVPRSNARRAFRESRGRSVHRRRCAPAEDDLSFTDANRRGTAAPLLPTAS